MLLVALSRPGWGWLIVPAMCLLWVAVRRASPATAFALGGLIGLVFFSGHLVWLDGSIGRLPWLLLTVVQAIYIGVTCAAMRLTMLLRAAPLWAALLWTAVEMARASWPLGGMPWGRLGFAAVGTPFDGLLPMVGVDGTTATLAFVGFSLGAVVTAREGSSKAGALVLAVSVFAVGVVLPAQDRASGSWQVAIVQGGVPGDGTELVKFHREVTRNHIRATSELMSQPRTVGVNLVLWPENAAAVDPIADDQTRSGLATLVSGLDAPLMFGAIANGPTRGTAFNRTFLWDQEDSPAAPQSVYTKQHLVPFGEYIPWRSLIKNWSSRFDLIPRDMLPGSTGQSVVVNGTQVAMAICFDIAYDDVVPDQVRRGAEVVLVQTSNASFFGTGQLDQQLTITRARALESARSVVVASTNGLSAVVGADGVVQEKLPRGPTAATVSSVDLSNVLTPAVRWQPVRSPTVAILALGSLLVAWGVRRSRALAPCDR